MLSLCQWC